MSLLVKTIPRDLPLIGIKPKFASAYYAISRAKLCRKASEIYCLENGTLTIDYSVKHRYRFSVHSSTGAWFSDPAQDYQLQPADKKICINQNVAFLEDRHTIFNICHFLFDKLGRSTEFKNINIDSFIIFQNNDYINYVFELLGMTQTNLEGTKKGIVTYQFDNLYVSSSTFSFNHPGCNFRPEVVNLLIKLREKCFERCKVNVSGRRLFVDRQNVGRRDVANRRILDKLLVKYEFESIIFENYHFEDQVSAVRGADVLMGVHGAGLSNGLFFNDINFKLLEIFPPLCATGDYWKLASAFGFQYDGYIADDLEFDTPNYEYWRHDSKLNKRNILIDYNKFDQFLSFHLDS